jgi:hypothetical protein
LERLRDGLTISDDRERLDIDRICAWLGESYWADDRDRAAIERSLVHSFPYGVYLSTGAQVALARATRDADGVYERVGFGLLRVPATWMEIDNRANRPSPEDVGPRR